MPPKKKAEKKKADTVVKTVNDQFEAQLAELGLGNALKLADEYDNDVECVTTGFPGLDRAIGGENPDHYGLPKRRHSELYSKKEGAGKTSTALCIGVTWQQHKLKVAVISIEEDVTPNYMRMLGYITDKAEADALGLYAVRLLKPQVKVEDCETDMVYVDQVLDLVGKAANIFDLVIIDSADALVSETEAEQSSGDNVQPGGIARKLKAFMRKNSSKRAHCLWLNHASVKIGQSGPPSYYTYGGKAIPRYSSLRFELTVIKKLAENDEADPYGFVTQIKLVKNRLGPNWRYVNLTYIFGEGFSKEYDYFETALKLDIVTKVGGWFYRLGDGKNLDERKKNAAWKCQGKFNTYKMLRADPERLAEIKQLINGEDVEPEVGVDLGDEAAVAAAEADDQELIPPEAEPLDGHNA